MNIERKVRMMMVTLWLIKLGRKGRNGFYKIKLITRNCIAIPEQMRAHIHFKR